MGVDHDKTTSWETSVDPGKVLVGSSDSPRQNGMEVKSLHALAKTPPPPHYSGQNHNLWSKIFEVFLRSFCYGLVSFNLCAYLFVRACHILCATAGNPRVKDKALSWPSSCPCTHVPSAHVPSAHVLSAHLLSAHVPMCPTKMESLISDVLPNIAGQKTTAFTKEKRRKRTTRK